MSDEAFPIEPCNQAGCEWQLRNRGKKKSNGIVSPPVQAAAKSPAADRTTTPQSVKEPAPSTPKISIPASGVTSEKKKETPSLIPRKPSEQKAEAVPIVKEEENRPFEDPEVSETWSAFKEERLAKGASDTEKLVLNRSLKKSGDNNVKIYLESQLEISILEKFETDMIRFFRKALGNTLIQVEKEVSEQDTSKQLYTSKEKFEYMVQQNPALRTLKDRLGLDFEY